MYCSVNGVIDNTIVNNTLPLTRHFWHSAGLGGKAYQNLSKVARRWLCTAVSTARVEGDFNKKKSLFGADRLQTGSIHACDELVINWNLRTANGLSCELPLAERKRLLPPSVILRPS